MPSSATCFPVSEAWLPHLLREHHVCLEGHGVHMRVSARQPGPFPPGGLQLPMLLSWGIRASLAQTLFLFCLVLFSK